MGGWAPGAKVGVLSIPVQSTVLQPDDDEGILGVAGAPRWNTKGSTISPTSLEKSSTVNLRVRSKMAALGTRTRIISAADSARVERRRLHAKSAAKR